MIYQYLIAAITLGIPALFGIALIGSIRILREKISTIAIGSILGITIFATSAYAIGHVVALTKTVLIAQLGILLILGCWLAWRGGAKNFARARTDRVACILLLLFLILFSVIGSKLLIERPDLPNRQAGGLYTGIINAYGDIGWHTAIIMEIAERKMLPIEDPVFAGHPLTYPFLANLVSSIMVIEGASLAASVNVPGMLLIPLLLVLMYFFAKRYGGSRTAGVIACLLFLFGGATFGFLRLPADLIESREGLVGFLLQLPARDYSGVGTDEQGFHFLNPITSLLLPQRAMLFGIPIVLSVLLLIHPSIIRRRYAPVIAGAFAGMLPLFHAHACIALATAIIAIFIVSPHKKRFVFFMVPALIIGIPELLFYLGGASEEGSFFRYGPGWMSGNRNHILYWFQNTGLLIPLSIIALFLRTPRPTKALIIAGSGLFILANTFLFAPWAWDNFKLFVFWLIFVLPSIGYIASNALHTPRYIVVPILACTLLIMHMLSAGLDIWKLALPTARTWGEWTQEGLEIATIIQDKVPANASIATAPVHNSPATLAGRTLILGYAAHVWSHGALPWNREAELKEYFEGKRTSIEGISPAYILIGPQEKSAYPNLVIQPTWQQIATHGPYTLLRQ